MAEAETRENSHAAEKTSDDRPVIHRVCEACNNMFPTHPGEKSLRCPKCTKE